jgi:hypothetical protein
MFEILGDEVHLHFDSPRRLTAYLFFLHIIKSHNINIKQKMSFYTEICFTKYNLLQNGFGVIQGGDIPVGLAPAIELIHEMVLCVEDDDSESSVNTINNIFKI